MAMDAIESVKQRDEEHVHKMFGLSYCDMLVLPRVLLQSMPNEWQERFVALIDDYNAHWSGLPRGFQPPSYRVQPTVGGRLARWAAFRLPHYSRGRCRVARDGSITGERFPRG